MVLGRPVDSNETGLDLYIYRLGLGLGLVWLCELNIGFGRVVSRQLSNYPRRSYIEWNRQPVQAVQQRLGVGSS